MPSHRRSIALIGALLLAAPFAVAAPAAEAATTTDPAKVGMYGAPDRPFLEFDAVFNHAIAVLGLTAAGGVVDPLAVDWIVKQQCADGGYVAFRADLGAPCPAPDSAAFTGEDTNSTALAALALRAIGRTTEAARAEQWLNARRSLDGGWAYYPDGASASDPNSTGVVLMALTGAGTPADASAYGASAQVPCGSADEGAFDYFGPNDLASAQGVIGFASGVLPPTAPGSWADDAPAVLCPALSNAQVASNAVAWLETRSASLTDSDAPWAILAFAAAGVARPEAADLYARVQTWAADPAFAGNAGRPGLAALSGAALGLVDDLPAYASAIDALLTTAPASPAPAPAPAPTPAATPAPTAPAAALPATLPDSGPPPAVVDMALVALGLLALGGGLLALGRRRRGNSGVETPAAPAHAPGPDAVEPDSK